MVLQFEHVELDHGPNGRWDVRPWSPDDLIKILTKWQTDLKGEGWNSIYFENHDQPRSLSRFGDEKEYGEQSAKLLATLLLTLKGTPYIYQGEEIGMTNCNLAAIHEYRDVDTLNFYRKAMREGMNENAAMRIIRYRSRDNARTPMQWNASPHAGFTAGSPWIGVNPNYTSVNVESEQGDPCSILSFYKKLIALRKSSLALVYGTFVRLPEDTIGSLPISGNTRVSGLSLRSTIQIAALIWRFPGMACGESSSSPITIPGRDSLQSAEMRPYESSIYKVDG